MCPGILFGVAIRTKKPLALNLSPLVWKLLVQEPVSQTDLDENDTLYAQSLRGIRDIHLAEVTETNFHEVTCRRASRTFIHESEYFYCLNYNFYNIDGDKVSFASAYNLV